MRESNLDSARILVTPGDVAAYLRDADITRMPYSLDQFLQLDAEAKRTVFGEYPHCVAVTLAVLTGPGPVTVDGADEHLDRLDAAIEIATAAGGDATSVWELHACH